MGRVGVPRRARVSRLPSRCPTYVPREHHNPTPKTKKPPASRGFQVVRDTGIEPVTSSVSGKRATAAPIAPMKAVQL